MKVTRIEDYFRGWFVGNFEPSCFKTSDFEVGLLTHKKDEVWPAHYHKISTEINLLLEGEMILNDQKLVTGDIFIISPNEIADPKFLTDCKLVVIKTPSAPTDKYII
jgi:quercetin dioxygenase-like cupin family protein